MKYTPQQRFHLRLGYTVLGFAGLLLFAAGALCGWLIWG